MNRVIGIFFLTAMIALAGCGKKRPVIPAPQPRSSVPASPPVQPEPLQPPELPRIDRDGASASKQDEDSATFQLETATKMDGGADTIPKTAEEGRRELEAAHGLFKEGDYQEAATLYRQLLENEKSGFFNFSKGGSGFWLLPTLERDRVIFNLAVCYAFPGTPVTDIGKARVYLRRFLAEESNSLYRAQVELFLLLYASLDTLSQNKKDNEAEILRLKKQLEEIKKFDLQRKPPD